MTLERVLEFLTLELPVAFLDSSVSMRMKRLVEILLFVLVDGWTLVVQSLAMSFRA